MTLHAWQLKGHLFGSIAVLIYSFFTYGSQKFEADHAIRDTLTRSLGKASSDSSSILIGQVFRSITKKQTKIENFDSPQAAGGTRRDHPDLDQPFLQIRQNIAR